MVPVSIFQFPSTKKKKILSCWGSHVCVNWNSTTHISLFSPHLLWTSSLSYSFRFSDSLRFPQTTHKPQNSLSIPCFKTICTVCPAGVARETLFAAGSVFSALHRHVSVPSLGHLLHRPQLHVSDLKTRNVAQENESVQANETDTKKRQRQTVQTLTWTCGGAPRT